MGGHVVLVQDGRRHGSGLLKLKVPGGRPLVFIGDWVEDAREGRGRIYQGAGRVLEGLWSVGRRVAILGYHGGGEGEEGRKGFDEEDVDMEKILEGEPRYANVEGGGRGDGGGAAVVASCGGGGGAPICVPSPGRSFHSGGSGVEEGEEEARAAVPGAAALSSCPTVGSSAGDAGGVVATCRIESSSVTAGVGLGVVVSPSPGVPSNGPSSPHDATSENSGSPPNALVPDDDLPDRSPTSAA